jgi:cytochrome b561
MAIVQQSRLRYDRNTILLHWTTAILITLLWVIGQIIDWFPRGTPRISVRSVHILLGATLLLVAIARITWRVRHGTRLPAAATGWAGGSAKAMHFMLYLMLSTTVVLGVLNVWGRGDKFFSLFAFPKLLTGNDTFKETVEQFHSLSANVLVILAVLHALAALVHHFMKRDTVLRRMLP